MSEKVNYYDNNDNINLNSCFNSFDSNLKKDGKIFKLIHRLK